MQDYAAGRSKMVAALISNCNDKNGRLDYARQLSKHVAVDIYGFCGTLTCPRPAGAVDGGSNCLLHFQQTYKYLFALAYALTLSLFHCTKSRWGCYNYTFLSLNIA